MRHEAAGTVRNMPVLNPLDAIFTPMKRTHEEAFGFPGENDSVTESVASSAVKAEPDRAGNAACTISKLKQLAEQQSASPLDGIKVQCELKTLIVFVKDAACFPLLCAQRHSLSALDPHCATLVDAGKDLDEDELLGAVAFAACVGGTAFTKLAQALAKLEGETLRLAVAQLKSAAQHCFNASIAHWLEKHYERIVENTFDVCGTLCRDYSAKQEKHVHVLDFHGVSRHMPVDALINTALYFYTYRTSATLLTAANECPAAKQLTAEDVQHLIFTVLGNSDVQDVVLKNEALFARTPLDQWEAQLEKSKTRCAIADAPSASIHLHALQEKHGFLPEAFRTPMIQRDSTLRMVCGEAQLGLNNVQEALGQYLAVRVSAERRIICTLGPGQGKSRVAALTALIYLTMNAEEETQVYVVFPNAHLMLRDQRAFRESFDCANL